MLQGRPFSNHSFKVRVVVVACLPCVLQSIVSGNSGLTHRRCLLQAKGSARRPGRGAGQLQW